SPIHADPPGIPLRCSGNFESAGVLPTTMLTLRHLLCLVFAGLFAAAASADTSVKGSPIETLVKEISRRQKEVRTLQAEFRQEKNLSLLAQPDVSSGTFVFSYPNRVRWEYQAPRSVTLLIASGTMTTYYPSLHKAEKVEIKGFEDRIFRYMGAAAGAIDDLGKYFDFRLVDARNDPFYTLDLTPKTKVLARRVQRITIRVDRQSYFTTMVEWVEGNGDSTRYEFTNIRVNEPVDEARFRLQLPNGVRVETIDLNR
ncbi:MAG TPA: outer membrane lipoprotein carrier protein LolA, partial [Thermoanaerobaculia bacterium]|nr:outer membrane lipoprotein carrier protein LolA [Thermoanaerobaculia bacterium]